MTEFSELGLAPAVLQAIDEVGYEAPSSIQAEAIPPLLAGRDLLGQAQTGTGKTAAFALPLLSRLDLELRKPQVLVLAPTRELAIQVAEAMQTYARHLKGFHVVPVYGGQNIETQLRHLRRGVHVVVGTPGRIQDHLRRRTLDLSQLQAVVLDEADEMLRMGFQEEVEEILKQTPEEKQVALFSATMPPGIQHVAKNYLRDPVDVHITTKTATVSTVSQHYWPVSGMNKLDALTRILEVEDFDAMLIFVRTKVATVELAEKLEARGFACAALNGDMNQALRERAVERLKNGKLDIVVATDVAARGLDVDRISHVVNYDIPYDVEAYVHRIGRTARAGREGKAILFVSPRERRMLYTIERVTRQRIEAMQLPSRQDVVNRRVAQLQQTLGETIESEELQFFEQVADGFVRELDTDISTLAAALTYLVQKDRPLLPPPEKKQSQRQRDRPAHEWRPDGGPRDRPDRQERQERPRDRPPRGQDADVRMQRYRIEVGRDHGVQPGNIVGALANESGLDGRHIGQIRLFDGFSLVDLPAGMPREILKHLKGVQVMGQELRIRADEGPPGGGYGGPRDDRQPSGHQRSGDQPRYGQQTDGEHGPQREGDDRPGPKRGKRRGPDGSKLRHAKLKGKKKKYLQEGKKKRKK